MGDTYAEDDQEKRAGLAVDYWDRKAFLVWLMQPDAWMGSRGIEEEEQQEDEEVEEEEVEEEREEV